MEMLLGVREGSISWLDRDEMVSSEYYSTVLYRRNRNLNLLKRDEISPAWMEMIVCARETVYWSKVVGF
jgi:hypothetical protein